MDLEAAVPAGTDDQSAAPAVAVVPESKAPAVDDDDEEEAVLFKPKGATPGPAAKPAAKPLTEQDLPPRRQFLFSTRSLTFLVEEGIRCLMDIEDIDSVLASLPPPQAMMDGPAAFERMRLEQQKHASIQRLCESLDVEMQADPQGLDSAPPQYISEDHLLFKFAKLPKGRLLIFRALLLLPPAYAYHILYVLVWDLKCLALATDPTSTDDRLASVAAEIMYNMPFPRVAWCFETMLRQQQLSTLVPVLRSKIGCAFAMAFMKKGHDERASVLAGGDAPSEGSAGAASSWRAAYTSLLSQLVGHVDALTSAPPAVSERKSKAELKEAAPVPSTVAPAGLASEVMLWELVAAVLSHATAEQRAPLMPEIRYRWQFQALVFELSVNLAA